MVSEEAYSLDSLQAILSSWDNCDYPTTMSVISWS